MMDKFVCDGCGNAYIGRDYHMMPEVGRVCDSCLENMRAANRKRVNQLSPGDRLRLIAGLPLSKEQSNEIKKD